MMDRPLKSKAKERLEKARSAIPNLKQLQRHSPEFKKWHRDTEIAISNTFGEDSRHINDFAEIPYSRLVARGTSDHALQLIYVKGLETATSILSSMLDEIEEYWENDSEKTDSPEPLKISTDSKEIFIIHGRDNGTKETVARFLTTLKLTPVILHEQPNQGHTVIEKFEHHAQVQFAIALLTPDDVGALKEEALTPNPRARQNVIFEFGYFMGRLGRKKVCALTTGDVEIPSDYSGVLYIPFDKSGAWRMLLVKELKAAGFNVDANLAL